MPDDTHPEEELSESLARMAGVLLSEETLDAVLDLISSLARSTLQGADGVGVTLMRDQKVMTAAGSDEMVSELDALQYENGEGPCLSALAEGKLVMSPSLGEETRWPGFTTKARDRGIASVHSFPLVVGEHSIGALNIYSKSEHRMDEAQRAVASMFAQQASVVLANAQAYAGAAELSEQLHEALGSREVIGEAKGILMEREGCTADEAFSMLRRLSQNHNVKLRDVAHQLVDTVQSRGHE